MKKVAIPVANDKLSEHFGACSYYEVFEIDGEHVRRNTFEMPSVVSVTELPLWLEEQGITDVITHRIKKEIIALFAAKKINLFVGASLKSTEELIDDYLQGKLESDKEIIQEIIN